jgi:hypothetical protein
MNVSDASKSSRMAPGRAACTQVDLPVPRGPKRKKLRFGGRSILENISPNSIAKRTRRFPLFKPERNIKLAFAKEHQAKLSPVGVTAAFLAKVEAEVRALEQSSGAQEAAIAQLPANTRAFCEAKGRLYLAIKDINSAGHALYAEDLENGARYNLKLLYRPRKAKGGETDKGTGTTATTATTATTTK